MNSRPTYTSQVSKDLNEKAQQQYPLPLSSTIVLTVKVNCCDKVANTSLLRKEVCPGWLQGTAHRRDITATGL